jgi:hypothetical protein
MAQSGLYFKIHHSPLRQMRIISSVRQQQRGKVTKGCQGAPNNRDIESFVDFVVNEESRPQSRVRTKQADAGYRRATVELDQIRMR